VEPSRKRTRPPLTKDRAYDLLFQVERFDTVCRSLKRLGVHQEDVLDVAQDVFLAAFRSFDSYDPDRSRPERWLNMIAVHLAAHYHDRASRRWEVPALDDDDEDGWPDPNPAVDEQLEGEQARTLVLDCLSALAIDHGAILIAHDIDEIPMKEIAQLHGLALSTLYRRRAEARQALREVLLRRIREEDPFDDLPLTHEHDAEPVPGGRGQHADCFLCALARRPPPE